MVVWSGSQIGSRDVGPESEPSHTLSRPARAFGPRPPRTYAGPAAVQLETYPRPRYVETQIFWFTPAPGGGFVLLFARLLMIGNEP